MISLMSFDDWGNLNNKRLWSVLIAACLLLLLQANNFFCLLAAALDAAILCSLLLLQVNASCLMLLLQVNASCLMLLLQVNASCLMLLPFLKFHCTLLPYQSSTHKNFSNRFKKENKANQPARVLNPASKMHKNAAVCYKLCISTIGTIFILAVCMHTCVCTQMFV